GRVLLQGGGDAFDCRSTASVRTESNQYTEPVRSYPGRVLLQGGGARWVGGAPPRWEAKENQENRAGPFAPGAGAPTGWGGAFDCRSTASVRSEVKPIHRARTIRTRGGCSYRVGVTRSVVGAPPRCEPSQTNTPSPPIRTRGGCSYRCCAEMKKPPHLSMRGLLIWRSGRDSNPRPPA